MPTTAAVSTTPVPAAAISAMSSAVEKTAAVMVPMTV